MSFFLKIDPKTEFFKHAGSLFNPKNKEEYETEEESGGSDSNSSGRSNKKTFCNSFVNGRESLI